MARVSGKKTAFLLVALGLVALGLAAWSFRDGIYKEWLIWELDSDDEPTRLDAAARLGELRSLRAVPVLVDHIIDEKREAILWTPGGHRPAGLFRIRLQRRPYGLTPLLHALHRIGPEAQALVQEALERRRKTADPPMLECVSGVTSLYAEIRKHDPAGTGSPLKRVSYDEVITERTIE